MAIGKMFIKLGEPAKQLKFLRQSVECNKDNGDAWLAFLQVCPKNELEAHLEQFESANPCHGDKWPAHFKKVENWYKKKSDVMKQLLQ